MARVANAMSGRFKPGNDPVATVWEAGCAPVPVWTRAENLSPTSIRSSDRPVLSESLYRSTKSGIQLFVIWTYFILLHTPYDNFPAFWEFLCTFWLSTGVTLSGSFIVQCF